MTELFANIRRKAAFSAFVQITLPLNFACKLEDACLPVGSDQNLQTCLDDLAFGFKPGAAERLLRNFVVDFDIIRIASSSCSYAPDLVEDLAQRGPTREFSRKVDRGMRGARRGQCKIGESRAAREKAVV